MNKDSLYGTPGPVQQNLPPVWLTITVAMAMQGLVRILDKFGDDYAPKSPDGNIGCTYMVVKNGVLTPVCIVGQFFADLGILGVLMTHADDEHNGIACSLEKGNATPTQDGALILRTVERLRARGVEVTEDARILLRAAQESQDNGNPWGHAVEDGLAVMVEETSVVLVGPSLTDRMRLTVAS